ncbi:peroxidase-like isoform X1 [Anopheles albimanus]|uniref:peroxidase-like isoform X1 n=1 Tax=Anopheles albimanus TaxID=7167 RepID=UPI00163EE566|nr:peroxidase-like isoform X1 [Anopheles albimanus]
MSTTQHIRLCSLAVVFLIGKCHSTIESCPFVMSCEEDSGGSPYRSADGSCNSRYNPLYGTAYRPYRRLLPAKYADGVAEPARMVGSGAAMPNARQLSMALFGETEQRDVRSTIVNMQFGQLVAHDLSFTADVFGGRCCPGGQALPDGQLPARCLPVAVPPDDPVLGNGTVDCMGMLRTRTSLEYPCATNYGQAEQLSSVTAFLDLSIVYGNSETQMAGLRSSAHGQMLVEHRNGSDWPPNNPNASTLCQMLEESDVCYHTGDLRSNQSPHLALLQIVFLLEHNRLARELAILNRHWDDERLFQEARKINIAQYQAIVYGEWLPIYMGRDNMLTGGLLHPVADDEEPVPDYDPLVDPTVSNEFGTAAFRYFHNMIVGQLDMYGDTGDPIGSLRLSDWLRRPGILEQQQQRRASNRVLLARGMVNQPHDTPNGHLSPEAKHYLFRNQRTVGVDLKAIDIQRARDHGLASYNEYRMWSGLERATGWSDLHDSLPEDAVTKLARWYVTVDDVELAVAGALERHHPGATVGRTFLTILLEQFRRTRTADRFFYENGAHFTGPQLAQIRRASIGRLLCDAVPELARMQRNAFFLPDELGNPVRPCGELEEVRLAPWQER